MKKSRSQCVRIYAQTVASSSLGIVSLLVSLSGQVSLSTALLLLVSALGCLYWLCSIDGKKEAMEELFGEHNYRKLNDKVN